MANTGLLTQGMTVEQAQILDQRLQTQRDAPFRQAPQNYGGGAMGGLLSASGQAVNSAALAGRNIGEFAGDAMTGRTGRGQENEIAAQERQDAIKAQEQEKLEVTSSNNKEHAINLVTALIPKLGEKQAAAMVQYIRADTTGKASQQVVDKYGTPDVDNLVNVGNHIFNKLTGQFTSPNTGKSAMKAKDVAALYEIFTPTSIAAHEKDPKAPLVLRDSEENSYDYTASSERVATAGRESTQLSELAHTLTSSNLDSGIKAQAIEEWKKWTGNQDSSTALRKQYELIKVSGILKYLPPGVASDKDVALVLQGVPDTFANPETMGSYVKGLAKLKQAEHAYIKAEVAYAKENKGSLKGFTEAQNVKALASYEKAYDTYSAGDSNFQKAYDQAEQYLDSGLNPIEVEQNIYSKFSKYPDEGVRNANIIIQLLKRRGKY